MAGPAPAGPAVSDLARLIAALSAREHLMIPELLPFRATTARSWLIC